MLLHKDNALMKDLDDQEGTEDSQNKSSIVIKEQKIGERLGKDSLLNVNLPVSYLRKY